MSEATKPATEQVAPTPCEHGIADDYCEQCYRADHESTKPGLLSDEEAELVIGAIPLQSLPTEQVTADKATPRPWEYLRDEGQFIVDARGEIVAEIPCQGCDPDAGELIVRAVNSMAGYEAAIKALRDLDEYYCASGPLWVAARAALAALANATQVEKENDNGR